MAMRMSEKEAEEFFRKYPKMAEKSGYSPREKYRPTPQVIKHNNETMYDVDQYIRMHCKTKIPMEQKRRQQQNRDIRDSQTETVFQRAAKRAAPDTVKGIQEFRQNPLQALVAMVFRMLENLGSNVQRYNREHDGHPEWIRRH